MNRPWSWTRFWFLATIVWYAIAGTAFALYLMATPHDPRDPAAGAMLIGVLPITFGMMIRVTYQIGMTIFGDRFPPR